MIVEIVPGGEFTDERRNEIAQIVTDAIDSNGGNTVMHGSESSTIEFTTGLAAVICALDIQSQVRLANANGFAEPVRARIGVHSPESHAFGAEAVAKVRSLLNLMPAGGILVTREVFLETRSVLNMKCDPVPGGLDVLQISEESLSGPALASASSDSDEPSGNLVRNCALIAVAVLLAAAVIWVFFVKKLAERAYSKRANPALPIQR